MRTKPAPYVAGSEPIEMQKDHGIELVAPLAAPPNGADSTRTEPRNDAERSEYPRENKGVYDQVANIVTARRRILVIRDLRLVTHLGKQALGCIGVGRRQDDSHQRTATFGHSAGQFLEIANPLHGDLVSRVSKNRERQRAFWAMEDPELRLG